MARVLDPETGLEREVSDADVERMVESERAVYTAHKDSGDSRVRLWDAVDATWTAPLPSLQALRHYLRKVVIKCLPCSYTTVFEGGVEKHIAQVLQQALEHREAKAQATVGPKGIYYVCPACVMLAQSGTTVERHIRETLEAGPKHRAAKGVWMFRFRLGPTEVPHPTEGPVVSGNGAGTPVTSQVERRSGRRRRHRSSHQRGGGG